MNTVYRASIRAAAFFCFVSVLAAQPRTLTILHTNDMHGGFLEHEAIWVRSNPKPLVGGFIELKRVVDSIRTVRTALLLDAGDLMTGSPVCEMTYKDVYGGALMEMLNRIGYDAWEPGNHDLDISQENLNGHIRLATFPTVNANIEVGPEAVLKGHQPYAVIERNGIRIGIIGIMSTSLYNLVDKQNLAGLNVLPPAPIVQKYIDELDTKTDLLIALTHQGVEDDSALAMNVKGLDIIVGGHSHTRLRSPKHVNGVIIVQAGSACENLGILDITVENDAVTSYNGKLHQLWVQPTKPNDDFTRFVDSLRTEIEKDYNVVVATLKSDWLMTGREMNVGNFVADAHREAAKTDVAFMNTHGMRRSIPAGPLTKKALFELMPFRNTLSTFTLTGAQIKEILSYYIVKQPAIQTSGIDCEYRMTPAGVEFVSIKINDKPLDEKAVYTAAASDYFIGEAPQYLGMKIEDPKNSSTSVFSIILEKAKREKVIDSKVEGRIREVR